MEFTDFSSKLLICSSETLGVKTMNAFRRALLNSCPCYAFPSELNQRQVEILRKGGITVRPNKKYFPVLYTDAGDLQYVNHRFSRLALNSEGDPNKYKDIVFLLNGTEPLVNNSNEHRIVTARDLKPYRYREEEDSVTFEPVTEYNNRDYFPYDTDLMVLLPHNSVMVALFPERDVGLRDSRWYPVCTRYRFVPKEELQREDSDLDKPDKVLLKEKEPLERFRQNKPIRVELGVEYNGRLTPREALRRTATYLVRQLEVFEEEYKRIGAEGGDYFLKRKYHPSRNYEQIITVYEKPAQQSGDSGYLGNPNLVELLTEQLILYLDRLWREESNRDKEKYIVNTLCASRKPHPADKLMVINFRLPLEHQSFVDLVKADIGGLVDLTDPKEIQDAIMVHVVRQTISKIRRGVLEALES